MQARSSASPGLQGMGQLSLFLSCFGMAEIEAGHIEVDGEPVVMTTPADAISAAIGISMMPEDRKTEALFLKLSGKHNASIPVISRFSSMGLINGKKETEAVGEVFRRVDVDERALWTRAGAFSGGNQQKIALAKWLLAESRALLLYDPTRGIDVGTKHEIYQLMRDLRGSGRRRPVLFDRNSRTRSSRRPRSGALSGRRCRSGRR